MSHRIYQSKIKTSKLIRLPSGGQPKQHTFLL
ncbi:MAG: hypothetical protein [Bacteroides phage LoVEphage]|nr:MAG: hypothetical protein [Bacteroides phage LoVEphage]